MFCTLEEAEEASSGSESESDSESEDCVVVLRQDSAKKQSCNVSINCVCKVTSDDESITRSFDFQYKFKDSALKL